MNPSLCRRGALGLTLLLGAHVALAAENRPAAFPLACTASLPPNATPAPNAPTWTGQLQLASAFTTAGGMADERSAPAMVWREACGGGKSAVLLRIDDPNRAGSAPANLLFPTLRAQQGGRLSMLRAVSLDGSTVVTSMNSGAIPGTYVLNVNTGDVDLNQPFVLQVQDALYGATQRQAAVDIPVPEYAPTISTYPLAFGPRPITGRYSGNFYDPAKPGEGIVIEIGELPNTTPTVRYLSFTWFTYDDNGQPFWISGGASLDDGSTHVHAAAVYRTGGRFAGGKAASETLDWGTVDFEYTECDRLVVDFVGNANMPNGIPKGSGHLSFQRASTISGFSCS